MREARRSLQDAEDESSAAHTPDRAREVMPSHRPNHATGGLRDKRSGEGNLAGNRAGGCKSAVPSNDGDGRVERQAGVRKGRVVRVEDASTADLMRILSERNLNQSNQLRSLLNRLLSVFPDSAQAAAPLSSPEGASSASTSPVLESPQSVTSSPTEPEETGVECGEVSLQLGCSPFDLMAKEVLIGLWPADRVVAGMMTCKYLRTELTRAHRVKLTLRKNFHHACSLQKDSFLQFSGRVELQAQDNGYLLPVVLQALIQAATAGWQGLSMLNLNNQHQMGPQGTESLGHTLRFYPGLKHLNLNGCQLECEEEPAFPHSEIGKLLHGLSECVSLEHLDLGYTDIGDCFVNYQPRGRNLRHLNLRGSKLSEVGVKHLCEVVFPASPCLQYLRLSISNLDGIVGLSRSLPGCNHLDDLGVESLAFGHEACCAMGLSLPKVTSLTSLDLSCSNLKEHEPLPEEVLRTCQGLRTGDFSTNDLRRQAVAILFGVASDALAYTQLSTLSLACNGIVEEHFQGHPGWSTNMPMMTSAPVPSLTCLDLSGNQLGSDGGRYLASGVIRRCSLLKSVKLTCTHLTAEGVKAVAQALDSCPCVQDVDFSWNSLGDIGAKHVAASLKKWPRIAMLDVSSCDIGTEGASLLAVAIPMCPRLKRLDSLGNRFTAEFAWTLGFPPLR